MVLAGGAGRRIGGGKPERILLGKTLLQRSLDLLQPFCPEVLVVGPEGIPDLEPGLGPLGGLLTALVTAQSDVLVVTVDMPALPPEVLGRLIAAREPGDLAVLAGEPFPGLYAAQVVEPLRLYLGRGERRAREFARSLNPRQIELDPRHRPGLELNVNTAEDLARAERLLLSDPGPRGR